MAVLDHHGVVEERHVGHAAVWVTRIEIGAEHAILFRGRGCDAHFAGDIGIALANTSQTAGRAKFVDQDTNRNAGAAVFAGRAVGDRLAAAEAALRQKIVEVSGALADQMGKDLAFLAAGEIGAGGWRGQIELRRVARVLGHDRGVS